MIKKDGQINNDVLPLKLNFKKYFIFDPQNQLKQRRL